METKKVKITKYIDYSNYFEGLERRSYELFAGDDRWPRKYTMFGPDPDKQRFYINYRETVEIEVEENWKVAATSKKEIRNSVCKIVYVSGKEVEFEVKDIYRHENKYALFGEIIDNGEKIYLLTEYKKYKNGKEEFIVRDIFTSCSFRNIFKKSGEERANFQITKSKDKEHPYTLEVVNGKRFKFPPMSFSQLEDIQEYLEDYIDQERYEEDEDDYEEDEEETDDDDREERGYEVFL